MKRRYPNFKPSRQDIQLAQELQSVLRQTEDIPHEDRWRITMELLPDSFLYAVLLARKRSKGDDVLNFYGLLAAAAYEEYADRYEEDDLSPELPRIALGLISVPASCLGELERRYKQFCNDVALMSDPFDFPPHKIIQYVPRDPENFDEKQVAEYAVPLCQDSEGTFLS